jgi:hypothetical protein
VNLGTIWGRFEEKTGGQKSRATVPLSLSEPEFGVAEKGYIPVGGSSEGVYKHLAGEGWASDISRPRTWD